MSSERGKLKILNLFFSSNALTLHFDWENKDEPACCFLFWIFLCKCSVRFVMYVLIWYSKWGKKRQLKMEFGIGNVKVWCNTEGLHETHPSVFVLFVATEQMFGRLPSVLLDWKAQPRFSGVCFKWILYNPPNPLRKWLPCSLQLETSCFNWFFFFYRLWWNSTCMCAVFFFSKQEPSKVKELICIYVKYLNNLLVFVIYLKAEWKNGTTGAQTWSSRASILYILLVSLL